MTVQRVYFDGSKKGIIVAVTADGDKYEQDLEPCSGCGTIIKAMKPIDGAGTSAKVCGCNQNKGKIEFVLDDSRGITSFAKSLAAKQLALSGCTH